MKSMRDFSPSDLGPDEYLKMVKSSLSECNSQEFSGIVFQAKAAIWRSARAWFECALEISEAWNDPEQSEDYQMEIIVTGFRMGLLSDSEEETYRKRLEKWFEKALKGRRRSDFESVDVEDWDIEFVSSWRPLKNVLSMLELANIPSPIWEDWLQTKENLP